MEAILTINAGSSSIKFSLFQANVALAPLYKGRITNLLAIPHFTVHDANRKKIIDCSLPSCGYGAAIRVVMEWIERLDEPLTLCAAGHRVVHGGQHYIAPTIIVPQVICALKKLIPLAPLHQPPSIEAIEALCAAYPSLLQVACFDTAFHANQDKIARMYALPRTFTESGILRYGFHGLSYEYINNILYDYTGDKVPKRVIIAHLGNGASMCALKDGVSIASSMGFTALEGLVMGTRSGSIDPGVLLYLLEEKKMSPKDIETLLYHQSGLLGVSGISYDMQKLLESNLPAAKEAIDLFCYRATQEIGALTAILGGVDTLVFTAGIGEKSPAIREKIVSNMEWLGAKLHHAHNNKNNATISADNSSVALYALPTDEELMIAQHTMAMI